MNETASEIPQRTCSYRILRYSPNQIRDEWVNIGVLLFDPRSGERRLRMIEEPEEYARVKRLHRDVDEALLSSLRDGLEERFVSASGANGSGLEEVLRKWDEVLSNTLQLAPPKGVVAEDLDAETERVYEDHVAVPRRRVRVGAPGSRARIRSYCRQVFQQARIWQKIEKFVPIAEFTFPGDPMRVDYSYRHNGTRGYLHTISVSRAPGAAKEFAYTAERIAAKSGVKTEFTAVTDIELAKGNQRDSFVDSALRGAGIEPVPLSHFAVWVGKLKPMIQ